MAKVKYKHYIGIDNGISATLSVLDKDGQCLVFCKIPTKKTPYYTGKKHATRIDTDQLYDLLRPYRAKAIVICEYPMINNKLFVATQSAMRSYEALEIVLEKLDLLYSFIPSRTWQNILLPGVTGRTELKNASRDVGIELYPEQEITIRKHRDADGLLLARYLYDEIQREANA